MTPSTPHVSWALAFLAGIVSFLSPCVMPLVPGYLSYVSGVSANELHAGASDQTLRVLGQSVLFVLGFALVFVGLGASASAIGALLADYRPVLNQISGVFIIAMGLSLLGVLRLGALMREHRLPLAGRPRGALGSTLLGAAFAFAWVPCVGPILASILTYAGSTGTVRTGALLDLPRFGRWETRSGLRSSWTPSTWRCGIDGRRPRSSIIPIAAPSTCGFH